VNGAIAVQGATGEVLWHRTTTGGMPTVGADHLFIGNQCSGVAAYALDGALEWANNREPCETSHGATTALHDGRVYVRSIPYLDAVFRASDGQDLRTFHSETTPAFAGTTGFRVVDGRLIAFDVVTGTTRWRTPYIAVENAPVTANGVVYAVTATLEVRAYRVASGTLLWKGKLDHAFIVTADGYSRVWTALAVAEGKLFIPTGRYLVAFAPRGA
jgi:outer membrane protein assembly factor BamB